MRRSINKRGLELVKRFEGFYSEAYLCPAGVWTIGYGHTRGVRPGQTVTENEAEAMLLQDLAEAARDVERLITVPLTDNQFAALVSFVFNVGVYNLQASTLRRKLNVGNFEAGPFELNRWVKATDPVSGKKRTLRGLVLRRAAEGDLWLTPDEADETETGLAMPQRIDNVDTLEDVSVPTLAEVSGGMRNLGYTIYDGTDRSGRKRNYDLNLFGIRTADTVAGAFDDWLGVFWMNWDTDAWEFHIWQATTDPGIYYLNQPLNVSGTAIMAEGQYPSSYEIGLHKGKYEALVQCKPIKAYRDNDRDEILDMMPDTIQKGLFGLNIHRASADYRSIRVDKWSAGCQVVADPRDFARLMDICQLAGEVWGPTFSYTLLLQEQMRYEV
jgi:lysozyme